MKLIELTYFSNETKSPKVLVNPAHIVTISKENNAATLIKLVDHGSIGVKESFEQIQELLRHSHCS